MIIGIPKEIKNNENRVALTPAGAKELVKRGHTVYVQHTAGINSGFADDAYVAAGARILPSIEDVYGIAEMIVKVKEPIASEYPLVRKGQLVFTYFHFASDEAHPCHDKERLHLSGLRDRGEPRSYVTPFDSYE